MRSELARRRWARTGTSSSRVETKRKELDQTVDARLPEAYAWVLVPGQERDEKSGEVNPQGRVTWSQIRLQEQDGLASRASKKLRRERAAHHLDGSVAAPHGGGQNTPLAR